MYFVLRSIKITHLKQFICIRCFAQTLSKTTSLSKRYQIRIIVHWTNFWFRSRNRARLHWLPWLSILSRCWWRGCATASRVVMIPHAWQLLNSVTSTKNFDNANIFIEIYLPYFTHDGTLCVAASQSIFRYRRTHETAYDKLALLRWKATVAAPQTNYNATQPMTNDFKKSGCDKITYYMYIFII